MWFISINIRFRYSGSAARGSSECHPRRRLRRAHRPRAAAVDAATPAATAVDAVPPGQ